MKNKIQNAFSLMEMMVVLLIVAIIAAATAPMVTKKMMRNAGSGDSPWVFTGLNNDIAYNMNGANASAIVGAPSYSYSNDEPTHPRLVLANGGDENRPSLVFADRNGNYTGQINMDSARQTVTMNNAKVGTNSVAIGLEQTIGENKNYVVAIGSGVKATANGAIAIGTPYAIAGNNVNNQAQNSETIASAAPSLAIGNCVQASGTNSIAIGHGMAVAGAEGNNGFRMTASGTNAIAIGTQYTKATGENAIAIGTKTQNAGALAIDSIAIGNGATASHSESVAIGHKAKTTTEKQIVLGGTNDVVYIPGKLVVNGMAVLGFADGREKADSSYVTVIRAKRNYKMEILERDNDGDWDALYADERIDYSWARKMRSDRRLKNVGEKYTAGLDELKKLDLYHYTFKDDKENTPQVGVMAQDLQKVFPDAVTKGEDGYLRIRLEDMFYAVINAVKELDTKITKIVADLSGLSTKVDEQQKVIDEQAQKIETLEKQNLELMNEIKEIEKQIKKIKK